MFDSVENTETVVQETSQENTQAQQNTQTQPQESSKEINLRIMRERAEQAERRALELERMIQMNMSQNQSSQKMQVEEDDFDIRDDDYVEGKHMKKYVKALKNELQTARKQFEEYQQQSSVSQAEIQLRSQFNDFDSVVTKENLEKLAALKPALYRTLMANNNIYDKGYSAYEMIKNSAIVTNEYSQQEKKLEDNKNKPRSAASAGPQVGETPLSRVGEYDRRVLTEERKAQLRRQVEEAKRFI